ncbi:MAG: polyprenyl diphosphate synthase, partial [Actinomycetota bacterium]|nr:polyprenyl diphosphate synthase [Actinomycetota bacterium]
MTPGADARYADPFPHPSGAVAPSIPTIVMPRHVAIVMDGNGRWANARGLPRTKGHEAGEASLLDVVAGAIEVGVTHLSAYAFSTENWRRSPDEVRFLMGFNRDVIRRRRAQLDEWGVRMRWVGRRPRLWRSVISELEVAQDLTKDNTGLTLY